MSLPSLSAFAEQLNTPFRVRLTPEQTFALTLTRTQAHTSTPRQEQFSVFFSGPPDQLLPQRIYHLEHETLGALDLFLVPIGRDQEGFQYEAVFNRMIS